MTISEREKKLKMDAAKVIMFNNEKKKVGGYELKSEPSNIGKIFKYMIYIRGKTFIDVAKKLGGCTPQNINHLFNRTKREHFPEYIIKKLCIYLRIDENYFYRLLEEVDSVLGVK